MKKATFLFGLIFIALIGVVFLTGCGKQTTGPETSVVPQPPTATLPTTQTTQQTQPKTPTQPTSTAENTVEITSSGFSPNTLTINAGDTVTFVNKDSRRHWPASAVHPTHTVYPETGGCIGSKFDACKGLAQGETYSFTFNQKGTWKYHDHLNPSLIGTIIVQ